jgi:hypothetical protein
VKRVRRVSRCGVCGERRQGVTTVSRGWTGGSGAASRGEIHLCDACVVEPSPALSVVLQRYLDEDLAGR